MANEMTVKKDIVKEHDLSVIEQVVMQGDLSKLTPDQRVIYYNRVCESMGLNPLTRPFDYISLKGKLQLYAKKDASEQLRYLKKISIIEIEGKVIDDLYIVKARAKTPDGREDQATGAVVIGSLKGEEKANAIMKAETKAKRRVTLSISGLGWVDESEIESIANAKKVDVDIETGIIKKQDLQTNELQKNNDDDLIESVNEIKDLFNQCTVDGKSKIMDFIKAEYSVESFQKIPLDCHERLKNLLRRKIKDEQRKKSENPWGLEEVISVEESL